MGPAACTQPTGCQGPRGQGVLASAGAMQGPHDRRRLISRRAHTLAGRATRPLAALAEAPSRRRRPAHPTATPLPAGAQVMASNEAKQLERRAYLEEGRRLREAGQREKAKLEQVCAHAWLPEWMRVCVRAAARFCGFAVMGRARA